MYLETDRIILRQWQDKDLTIFAELNADPEVMRYFSHPLSRQESDELAQKCQSLILKKGWGFWAVELKSCKKFIGFLGLHNPKLTLPFSPCIEIGWRLHKKYWGNGYATEAATEVLHFAFNVLDENEVVSFTTLANFRSRAVMQRLGFKNVEKNFNHPDLPIGHPLSEHVLYKITQDQWCAQKLLVNH